MNLLINIWLGSSKKSLKSVRKNISSIYIQNKIDKIKVNISFKCKNKNAKTNR